MLINNKNKKQLIRNYSNWNTHSIQLLPTYKTAISFINQKFDLLSSHNWQYVKKEKKQDHPNKDFLITQKDQIYCNQNNYCNQLIFYIQKKLQKFLSSTYERGKLKKCLVKKIGKKKNKNSNTYSKTTNLINTIYLKFEKSITNNFIHRNQFIRVI